MQSHWKGGSKTNFTGRQHDHFRRKPDGFNNKATEFSKVVKYQINILKLILFCMLARLIENCNVNKHNI